jgi:hypothetical protein
LRARRHWPVIVAAAADLTRGVAAGASSAACPPAGPGFPLPLAEASPGCKPDQAYPVLVIGTQARI